MRVLGRVPVSLFTTPSRSILVACVVVVSMTAFVGPVVDPDFWYHVATGRWILAHGALPSHDLYTFTASGHRWVDYEYLSEVLLWLLYAHGGVVAVGVAFGVLGWVGFVFLYLSVALVRPPYLVAAGALVLAVAVAAGVWEPRPQVVTFTFASIELYLLRRFLGGGGGGGSVRWIWLYPVAIVPWANLHAGWPVAWLLLAVAAGAEAWGWLAGSERPWRARRLRVLGVVGVASAVAPLVGPLGVAVYTAPLAPLASPAQQVLISEWQSPDLRDPWTWPLVAVVVLLVVGVAVARPRPRAFDVLLTACTLAMTVVSVRQVALFVLAAAPLLASAWGGVVARWRPGGGEAPERRWLAVAALAVTCAVTCAVTLGVSGWRVARPPTIAGEPVPAAAAGWLGSHPGVGARMFNAYAWGGYLAFRLSPTRRVYVYGEGTVMGDALLWRYEAVQDLRPGWRRILAEDRVDYVVTPSTSPLAAALASDPTWRRAYHDPVATIYLHR